MLSWRWLATASSFQTSWPLGPTKWVHHFRALIWATDWFEEKIFGSLNGVLQPTLMLFARLSCSRFVMKLTAPWWTCRVYFSFTIRVPMTFLAISKSVCTSRSVIIVDLLYVKRARYHPSALVRSELYFCIFKEVEATSCHFLEDIL